MTKRTNLLDEALGGKSFPMTVLTPVRPWKQWIARLILWVFSKLPLAPVRPLHMIHFARWTVIPARYFHRFTGVPATHDDQGYLLFTTNFNGPWDQYIDAFAMIPPIRRGMNFMWGTSDGFPGAWPLRRFKQYIRYHQYAVQCYHHAYPGISVHDIDRAMTLKDACKRLQANATNMNDKEFCAAFVKMIDEHPNSLRLSLDDSTQLLYADYLSGLAGDPDIDAALHKPLASERKFERFLTTVSPIRRTGNTDAEKVESLKAELWRLQEEVFPFLGAPMIHMIRLQLIEDMRGPMGRASEVHRDYAYLLMVVELDGSPADFFDWLYRTQREHCMSLWGHCVGAQHIHEGEVFFRRYMQECQVDTNLGYAGYDYTVREIQQAVFIQVAVSILASFLGPGDDLGVDPCFIIASEWEKQVVPVLNRF